MGETAIELLMGATTTVGPEWGWHSPQTDAVHRLYMPAGGQAWVAMGDRWHVLRDRGLVLLPGQNPLALGCPKRFTVHWFHFRARGPRLDRQIAALGEAVRWNETTARRWRIVAHRAGEAIRGEDEALRLRVEGMILTLVGDALARRPRARAADNADPAVERLRPAVEAMDQRYRPNPPLRALARHAGLSIPHFRRLFRQVYDITPHAYMERKRLAEARRLLIETAMPIQEVAEATGHGSVYTFSRVFRARHGMSPRAYRRQGRGHQP